MADVRPTDHVPHGSWSRRAAVTGAGVLGVGLLTSCSGSSDASPDRSHTPAGSAASRGSTGSATSGAETAGTSESYIRSGPTVQSLSFDAGTSKGGLMSGPHLTLLVRGRQFTDELSGENRFAVANGSPSDTPLRAPAGHEWLLLALRASATLQPSSSHTATASLHAGSTEVDLAAKLGRYQEYVGYTNRFVNLAVVVPKKSPVTVHLGDAGKKLTYDLCTMQAAKDADSTQMMEFARGYTTAVSPAKLKWAGGWSDGRNSETIKLAFDLDKPERYAWSGTSQGWAPKGKVFVRLKYSLDFHFTYSSDLVIPASGITLRANGKTYPAVSGDIKAFTTSISGYLDHYLVFQVPHTFTTGTLTIAVPRTTRIRYREGNTATVALRGTGTMSAKVTTEPR